jgi:hypothetical protein
MMGANRAQRRAVHAVQRKTGGVLVDPEQLEQLHSAQRMFVAIVKEQGRVRVSDEVLKSLDEGDRVTAKHEGGALLLSYVAAKPEGAST